MILHQIFGKEVKSFTDYALIFQIWLHKLYYFSIKKEINLAKLFS